MDVSLNRVFRNAINEAITGWKTWRGLLKGQQITNELVLLLPSDNDEYNYYAIAHLKAMLEARGLEKAVVVTEDKVIKQYAQILCDRIKTVVSVGKKRQDALVRFCGLYNLESRCVVGSLEHPNGRGRCLGLLETKDMSVEKLLVLGVCQLVPFRHREIIVDRTIPWPDDLMRFLSVPERSSHG